MSVVQQDSAISSGPPVCCIHCGTDVPMNELQDHLRTCHKETGDDECEILSSGSDMMSEIGILQDVFHQNTEKEIEDALRETGHVTAAADMLLQKGEATQCNFGQDLLTPGASSTQDWATQSDPQQVIEEFRKAYTGIRKFNPSLRPRMDLRESDTDRDKSVFMFYKRAQDWGNPVSAILDGDIAVGDGVRCFFLSYFMDRLQTGFNVDFGCGTGGKTLLFEGTQDHLVPSAAKTLTDSGLFEIAGRIIGHSFLHGGPRMCGLSPSFARLFCGFLDCTTPLSPEDCFDVDVKGAIVKLQCSEVVLDEKLKTEATAISVHWDLTIVTVQNRYWYAQQLLVHAVVDRRQKAVQQVQKGLKECGILEMVQRQPTTVGLLFPPASEADIDREVLLRRIVWPRPDDCSVELLCRVTAFLRTFIQEGSQHELKNLIKFWIGWEMLPTSLHVEIKDDVDFLWHQPALKL